MSTCISQHGEFSEHEPNPEWYCRLCGSLDEAGMRAELQRAWSVAAQRRNEARRYYVAWQNARMRARDYGPGLSQAEAKTAALAEPTEPQ